MTQLVDATLPKGTYLLPGQKTTATAYPQRKTAPVTNRLLMGKVTFIDILVLLFGKYPAHKICPDRHHQKM